jgi:hypothetical protein
MSVVLASCAVPPRQAYNRDLNKEVKSIGLLQPAFSGEYVVENLGHPGQMFGLVGAVVAATQMQANTNEFTVKAKDTKFDALGDFTGQLEERLVAAGYTVKRIDPKRTRQFMLDSYVGLDPSVDAYLDLVLHRVGYVSAAATTPYLPSILVSARLVKRGGGEILYTERIAYGFQVTGVEVTNIASLPKYQFPNFSDLKADVPLAAEGIKLGLPLVVDRISNDLKRAAP